jgi:hypothetical protein
LFLRMLQDQHHRAIFDCRLFGSRFFGHAATIG